ncbi:MAG: serine protease, partial [Raoultibacter sp.]
RKWDNVKHISDHLKTRMVPRKSYEVPLWGILLRKKERQSDRSGNGLRFGVVITLREMNGVNRIDEFMQQCMLRGWLVSRIDITNRLDIYEAAEIEIDFDE